jgi:hypothetical protein
MPLPPFPQPFCYCGPFFLLRAPVSGLTLHPNVTSHLAGIISTTSWLVLILPNNPHSIHHQGLSCQNANVLAMLPQLKPFNSSLKSKVQTSQHLPWRWSIAHFSRQIPWPWPLMATVFQASCWDFHELSFQPGESVSFSAALFHGKPSLASLTLVNLPLFICLYCTGLPSSVAPKTCYCSEWFTDPFLTIQFFDKGWNLICCYIPPTWHRVGTW